MQPRGGTTGKTRHKPKHTQSVDGDMHSNTVGGVAAQLGNSRIGDSARPYG